MAIAICERCLWEIRDSRITRPLPDGTLLHWHRYCYNFRGEVEKYAERVARANTIPGLIEQ